MAAVSRLRGFQREMLKEQKKRQRAGAGEQTRLLEVLGMVTQQVTRRARLMRLEIQ